MTSQIMKNGQDVIIQMGSGVRAPDRVNIPCLMHDTRLCQLDVKMTNNYVSLCFGPNCEIMLAVNYSICSCIPIIQDDILSRLLI